MSNSGTRLTRRNFLRMVGAAGGTAAVHETLVALGLMRHPDTWAGPPKIRPGIGKNQSVLILGAGVGGLATAYRLTQSGYDCRIYEAQNRAGGRSYTARRGNKVFEESEENGKTEQACQFDEGLYVNLGPGRIPYHHRRVINLCRELEVDLEVYVHTTDTNLHRMAKGPLDKAYARRRIAYDTKGYIAELLAKAVNQRAFDHELSNEDKEKLLSLLQKFGDLNNRFKYTGSTRAGCKGGTNNPHVCGAKIDEPIEPLEPLGLTDLLRSEFWDPCIVAAPRGEASCNPMSYGHGFYQVKEDLWQTTSFQPVGGMDKIVDALRYTEIKVEGRTVKLDDLIRLNTVVTGIAYDQEAQQVKVTYNGTETMDVDFCVSNIPLTVLKDIDLDGFSPTFHDAIRRGAFSNACKVGWQANKRFWELKDYIFGGISWIEHPITQMWYPSNDYFSDKGVLTGAYNYARTARDFGRLPLPARLDKAYEGGRLLHEQAFEPGGNVVPKDLGISIAWQNVPYQKGCSAVWNSMSDQDEADFERLLAPDLNNRFYIVGDQVSSLPGWQEGALMSAEHVFDQIVTGQGRDLEDIREQIKQAPMTLEVMG